MSASPEALRRWALNGNLMATFLARLGQPALDACRSDQPFQVRAGLRLRGSPALAGEIELHALELELLLEEDVAAHPGEIHLRWRLGRRAGRARPRLGPLEVVDLEAEVVEAV